MSEELKPCPFCGSPAMADSGFAPAESIIYAFCSNNDCRLHSVDVGLSPEEWNQRALPAINPQPPTVAITWHDSPESVHRAMWEESAVAAGMTYEQMVDESVSCGKDEHGNEIEFTHEQEIAGMRQQGCWAFVDARSNIIHAWADESASREFVLHMLAHEIGHITGDAHTDDFQEEMRAEQFGRVARAAYRLLPPVKADYAALEAECERLRGELALAMKVPSVAAMHTFLETEVAKQNVQLGAERNALRVELERFSQANRELSEKNVRRREQVRQLREALDRATKLLSAAAGYATKMEPMPAKLLNAIDAELDASTAKEVNQ